MSARTVVSSFCRGVAWMLAGLVVGLSAPAQAQSDRGPTHGVIRGIENQTVLVELADTLTVEPGVTGRVVQTRSVGGQQVQMNVALLRVRRVEQMDGGLFAWCRIQRESRTPQEGDRVRFAEVQSRQGRVTVRSQPEGATVVLDGDSVGTTPLRQRLAPGRYDLRVEASGYRAVTQPVRVQAAQEQQITVTLAEIVPATLSITTEPAGATVILNGERTGTTPFEQSVPSGSLTVRLERDAYRPATRQLELVPGARRELSVTLEPEPASLTVRSTPTGASVLVDGDTLGTTPLSESLSPDTYDVRIAREGLETAARRVTLVPNEQRVLSVALQAARGTLAVTSLPDGATVTVDGDTLGTTPVADTLAPGTYALRIDRDGYLPHTQTVRVQSTSETRVSATLRRPLEVQMAEVQPEVVRNAQVTREGDRLVIAYALAGDDAYTVSLQLSTNGGRTFETLDATAQGAIGEDVTAGAGKQIVWAVLEDLPQGLDGSQNRLRIAVDRQGGNGLLWMLGGALVAGAGSTLAVLLTGGDDDGDRLPTPPVPP